MDPNTLNLRQLRNELRKLNMSPSGSKADLVKRLKKAIKKGGSSDSDTNTPNNNNNTYSSTSMQDAPLPAFRSNNKRKLEHRPKVVVSSQKKQRISEDYNSNEEDDDFLSNSDEDEDIMEQEPPQTFNRRQVVGLSDEEIERRRKILIDMGALSDKSPDINAKLKLPMAQQFFFEQARLELERVEMQRKYDTQVQKLEYQVERLRQEIEEKDSIIAQLRDTMKDKHRFLSNTSQEVVFNWNILERALAPVNIQNAPTHLW